VLGPGQETAHTALTPRGRTLALQVRPPVADDSNTPPVPKAHPPLPDNQQPELVGQYKLAKSIRAGRPRALTLDQDSPPSLETSTDSAPPVPCSDEAMQLAGVAQEK
jgi:hypothetical protein